MLWKLFVIYYYDKVNHSGHILLSLMHQQLGVKQIYFWEIPEVIYRLLMFKKIIKNKIGTYLFNSITCCCSASNYHNQICRTIGIVD